MLLIIDKLPFEGIWRAWGQSRRRSQKANSESTTKLKDENEHKAPVTTAATTEETAGTTTTARTIVGATATTANPKASTPHSVRFHIHAKYPARVQSAWVRERLIAAQLVPEWGSVELARAMLELMSHALRKSKNDNDVFVFASESCVPTMSFEEASRSMIWPIGGVPTSWLRTYDRPHNGYAAQQQWDCVDTALVERGAVFKSDQWVLLRRLHCEMLIGAPRQAGKDLWPAFARCVASDEMYIPSVLVGLLGLRIDRFIQTVMDDGGRASTPTQAKRGQDISCRRVTYVDWSKGGRGPCGYDSKAALRDAVVRAKRQGCIFVRKVQPSALPRIVDDWSDILGIPVSKRASSVTTLPEPSSSSSSSSSQSSSVPSEPSSSLTRAFDAAHGPRSINSYSSTSSSSTSYGKHRRPKSQSYNRSHPYRRPDARGDWWHQRRQRERHGRRDYDRYEERSRYRRGRDQYDTQSGAQGHRKRGDWDDGNVGGPTRSEKRLGKASRFGGGSNRW